MININKMYCSGNNEVVKACADERCTQHSLLCGFQRCKCSEGHKLCKGVIEYQPTANQIIQKATQLRKPFENLIFWYNSISRQVLSDRDEMLKKIDQLVDKMMDSSEAKFYQALNDGKSWKLTGEIMSKIAVISKKPFAPNNNLQEQIKTETIRAGKDLQDQLAKLRKFWDLDKDDKQSLEKLKKFGIKWTWLNGKWIKPVPEQFALSDLTGLGLDYIDPVITKHLANSCPKLQGLQVGYWVNNSNFDDVCAEAVAQHLPQLKRLWIYNSPLTDKGSTSISNSLKALEYLILNNCKLTAVGKSEVRRLLPECKKIQLL